ncbi:MAG: tRNA adenosine(34) deaminase TadA [Gammaproteobacteria bacterium]|nr:tRNA adenosine(34) deaminase TadA [Gammaproteobacteria bacterium]
MSNHQSMDEHWMRCALVLARYAEEQGEVPVGAVIVKENKLVSKGCNSPIEHHDPTAHAEIRAIRNAGQILRNYRMPDTTLYVTLEPCHMCLGAMLHARIKRLVFGAQDTRTGAAGSVFNLAQAKQTNHRIELTGGMLGQECAELLQGFFKRRRQGALGE